MTTTTPRALALGQRARAVMPLGVNSNARHWAGDRTMYVERARGSHVWDVDGNEYIDLRLGFGPIILGYAYPEVDEAVIEAIGRGVSPGLTTEVEVEVCERLVAACPALEQVRLVNTGSEATMHALRVARAFTGREKVVKLEGGYHGSYDYMLFSTYAPPTSYGNPRSPISIPASSGIPRSLSDLVITVPFNDCDVLESTIRNHGREIAAIVTEPMLGNFGCADAAPGYFDLLRQLCDEYGIVWILDEVKSGFRVALGGAQERFGYRPDLASYAKSLGNGYPVGAYGGRADIMQIVGRGVTQGGTFAGNLASAAAARATLDVLSREPVYDHLERLGQMLRLEIQKAFADAGIAVHVSSLPAIFGVAFELDLNVDARSWSSASSTRYGQFARHALSRGVLLDDDPREPLCLSFSHSDADVQYAIEVFRDCAQVMSAAS